MKERFCGNCEHLSITEHEQNEVKELSGRIYPHVCTKYKTRVFHFPYQEPFICRCVECMQDYPTEYGTKTETCVSCGEIIPEGRQVCPNCEKGGVNYD